MTASVDLIVEHSIAIARYLALDYSRQTERGALSAILEDLKRRGADDAALETLRAFIERGDEERPDKVLSGAAPLVSLDSDEEPS